ncbi:MAG: DUF6527 family protein [Patescibacteria group bacterium]
MPKAEAINGPDGVRRGYIIYCPACKTHHVFYTNHSNPKCNWSFNGDCEKPTFAPSMLVKGHLGADSYGVCHSFVRNGQIQYLNDCTHNMAGQTMDLPDIDD